MTAVRNLNQMTLMLFHKSYMASNRRSLTKIEKNCQLIRRFLRSNATTRSRIICPFKRLNSPMRRLWRSMFRQEITNLEKKCIKMTNLTAMMIIGNCQGQPQCPRNSKIKITRVSSKMSRSYQKIRKTQAQKSMTSITKSRSNRTLSDVVRARRKARDGALWCQNTPISAWSDATWSIAGRISTKSSRKCARPLIKVKKLGY